MPEVNAKALNIRSTIAKTRQRRKNQQCKSYELKIDKSHLSSEKTKVLQRVFLETKWFYNYILAQEVPWKQDYKLNLVKVKTKDGTFEDREILYLSSQVRQEIIDRLRANMRSLSAFKKNGGKTGPLKFKSQVNSIPLKQYGNTYKVEKNYVKIQKVGKLRVRGLKQIPENSEFANAVLLHRNGDYFLRVNLYMDKEEKLYPLPSVGVDAGVKTQITLSNGIAIKEGVPITPRVEKLHRKLSKKHLHSKNWYKTLEKHNKEYIHILNKKKDIRKKIVFALTSTYDAIKIQDDDIAGWKLKWGKRIEATAIGGIMSEIRRKSHTLVTVPRGVPTSQICSRCGNMQRVTLKDRSFNCEKCGLRIDRDLNSAINMENESVPAERREVKPEDTQTSTTLLEYLNSIPGVSASLVNDPGSLKSCREVAHQGVAMPVIADSVFRA